MKVKELIFKLSRYNQDWTVDINADNIAEDLEVDDSNQTIGILIEKKEVKQ